MAEQTVSAGLLPPWHVGQLPEPPHPGWRLWIGLVGPGVVLAGTSIGSGEWLFGPAVTAQYGATFLWLATISIVLQVFCNLMMMRLHALLRRTDHRRRHAHLARPARLDRRLWPAGFDRRHLALQRRRTPPGRWQPPFSAICRERAV